MALEQNNLIDLFFTDECGFSLIPNIPYGWQPIGKQLAIKSAKQKVTNLFGLLSCKGKLKAYATMQNINSDFIIECIDEIALKLEKPTVLVMDNAPWHKSEKVLKRQRHWAEKNLYLFFLPKYSPHLNLIETLWRKIKYEWLRPHHYLDASTLRQAVFDIIRNYDNQFSINFSKNFFR